MEKLNIDCLILIFNKSWASLHSCLLVNREWCHLVVPILWEECPNFYESKLIEKYFNVILSYLPSSSKQRLFNCNIKLPSTIFLKPLTFNYISYCKSLDYRIVNDIINTVLKEETRSNAYNYSKKRNLLEQEIYKLYISQCKSIKRLILNTSQPLSSFPEALTLFSQLCCLTIKMKLINSDNLYEMAQICKYLSKLIIDDYSQDIPGLISLIDAQRNLNDVVIYFSRIKQGTCEELSKALARKGCTITNLSLYNSVGIISHSFLTSLIRLRDLSIAHNHYCNNYENVKEFQQYLAISEFPNLRCFWSDEISCFKELALLIAKTKGNIIRVRIYTYNEYAENMGMLIKAIADNCPKIENLSTDFEPKDLIYIKSLLLNCRNLVKLNLVNSNENDIIGDELFNILIEFSSKSLTKIRISGNQQKYSIDVFESFLESYRGRKLLSFDIMNSRNCITIEHVKIVRKYFDEGIIRYTNILYDY
jgi:hypothetical protein